MKMWFRLGIDGPTPTVVCTSAEGGSTGEKMGPVNGRISGFGGAFKRRREGAQERFWSQKKLYKKLYNR